MSNSWTQTESKTVSCAFETFSPTNFNHDYAEDPSRRDSMVFVNVNHPFPNVMHNKRQDSTCHRVVSTSDENRPSSSRDKRASISSRQGSSSSTGRHGSTQRPPNDVDLVYMQSLTNQQIDKWKIMFDEVDVRGKGELKVTEFQKLLRNPSFCPDIDRHTIEVLQMKCLQPNKDYISYQEFINIMSNKRNESFRLAVTIPNNRDKASRLVQESTRNTSCFVAMVRTVAKHYLTNDVERQYYEDKYTCCPPPLFIPAITIAEVGFYAYHCIQSQTFQSNGPIPIQSWFIYRPDKRVEIWRFLLYMFLHSGYLHLIFNMIVQLLVGLPLEMVHGSVRILMIYLSGVLAGSLGTSVFDRDAYLVGASGGVYALLAGHIANVMLNYSKMSYGALKSVAILVVASADVGVAIWGRYVQSESSSSHSASEVLAISYLAHLMGVIAGLAIGLVVLKNFEQKLYKKYLWWFSLSVYILLFLSAVCWNLFVT